jgi:hypothetical protein
MAGNQSRGLIAASKTRGWDPTRIPAGGPGQPEQDLAAFDVDQGNAASYPVGRLPGGPVDAWEDGISVGGLSLDNPSPTFRTPDAGRENANRRTRDANAFPGMPGALSKGRGK